MKKRHPHKQNVLLVNITRLGDMLQATPTIAGMKMENPDCKITVLVEKQFEAVCHTIPNIDDVVAIDLGMTVRSLAREQEGVIDAYEYITEFVEDLRSRNFDYVLNMSSSAYTALLLNLLGIPNKGGWSSDDEGYRMIESEWAQLFATSVFHQNRQYNSLNLVDVFRCSADVDLHPQQLLINVTPDNTEYVEKMLQAAPFTNDGPLVVVQAGASQAKRQWAPINFIRFIKLLVEESNCRVVLSGTKKELQIIEPIVAGVNSPNVFVAAGQTNIPQLAALLKMSELLVTGDTGPMHMSVAVGTPVVSMFLASAFGFETGPYSEGNIVLQPVIGCGPCNPNKACFRPDCHTHISPEMLAELTIRRLQGDFTSLPEGYADPGRVIIYRTFFDENGFYDLMPLNTEYDSSYMKYREAYRMLWLDELGGFKQEKKKSAESRPTSKLQVIQETHSGFQGIEQVESVADEAHAAVSELQELIKDVSAPATRLGEMSNKLGELDRQIEEIGFHYPHLGPLTRMFVFAKENISGSDAYELASQMSSIYSTLKTRCEKLQRYYS